MKEIALLVCVFFPSWLIALTVWWREPRLWWASLGILLTGTGVVLYLPIRFAFHTPSSEFDGLGIFAEFMVLVGFAIFVNLALLLAIQSQWREKSVERKNASATEEAK